MKKIQNDRGIRKAFLRIVVLLCSFSFPAAAMAQWESWRGPEQTGVSRETGLPSSTSAENILWRQPIGGRSTPAVHRGRVFIITRGGAGPNEHERVVAFELETGKVLWERRLSVFHTDIPGPRVGWASPAVDPETGYVYIHGVQGLFNCYDRDGGLIWSRSLTEEQGRISGYGGRTNTPVIDGDLVILSFLNSSWGAQGPGAHRFTAVDKRTGDFIWWSSPGKAPLDTTYSTPVIAVVNGMRLLITGGADGWAYGLKVRTGEKVWEFALSERGLNVSPVVGAGGRVFISHSEENLDTTAMGRVVGIDGSKSGDLTKAGELWRIDEIGAGYCSPLIHGGRLYVIDNSANLIAIDAASGRRLWHHSLGTVGKGSAVWGDGKIYAGEVNGRFHILEPGDAGCRSLGHLELVGPDGTPSEIFGSPAVANGRIIFTTRDETVCLGEKEWKGKAGEIPALPPEPPPGADDAASFLLVTPAEALASPGERLQLRARLFNARGQYLRDAAGAEWSLAGLAGSLDERGGFTVAAERRFQAGEVRVRAGSLEGAARVRVVHPLPVVENFDAVDPGKLPPGWIGLSPQKFKVVDLDGERVLMKDGSNSRFVRAEAFVGPAAWKDYTIEADVRGNFKRRSLPDMGIIGQRYNLLLMGNKRPKILRLNSWLAQPRVQKDAPFDWKEDVWYRMKLRIDRRGDGALVRAKAWPRGEAEPEAWTIELEDPLPNLEGGPGINAFSAGTTAQSAGTDVYFDNIKIIPNE